MFRSRGQDSGYDRESFRSFAPVKPGDELSVTIEAVGEKGDGIAKKDGFVIFIPGVKEGDHVRIRITKVFKKVGFGEVIAEGAASEGETEETQETASEEEPEEAEAEEETSEESTEDSEDFGEKTE